MKNTSEISRKWFEDFEEGFSIEYSIPGLTATEIVKFAQQYDPQRFHLNEEEAKNTHFGGLVASGFQTQLLCFRPFCEEILQDTMAVGAPGIDSLKWLRPWFPGESLDVEVSVVSKRLSSKRNDRCYLGLQLNAEANGVPTLAMEWMVIMLTKEGAGEIE